MKTFCTTTLSLLAAANAVENTAPVISLSLDAYTSTHQGHGTDSEDHSLCGNDAAALAARNTDAATASECIEYDAHVTEASKAAHASTVDGTTYKTSHPHSFAAKGPVGTGAAADERRLAKLGEAELLEQHGTVVGREENGVDQLQQAALWRQRRRGRRGPAELQLRRRVSVLQQDAPRPIDARRGAARPR